MWGCLVLAGLGLLVSLTVRDLNAASAMIFFGTPWLVRLGLVFGAVILIRKRSRLFLGLCAFVALQASLDGARSCWRRGGDGVKVSNEFDVTLWNTGRKLADMPEEWAGLFAPETRLAVIVEAGSFSKEEWARFLNERPDVQWEKCQGGILVGVRGKVLGMSDHGDGNRFRCQRVKVEIDGNEYSVLGIDIPSQPWISRDGFLDKILNVSAKERCLVLGDFNTPPAARGFDEWKGSLHLANAEAGRGFMETWTYGLPVLTLDQLWLSNDLRCGDARKDGWMKSDHSRMRFRVGGKQELR